MKRVLIIGGGVVGLCSAHYLSERGFQVTVVDRDSPQRNGCSYGNAGLVVPSHFVPLAAPGMVALGLRCMWNPESPFYLKPRLSLELLNWGWKFWRAANRRQVERAGPLLRDLHLASRAAYEELVSELGPRVSLVKNGVLLLCATPHAWQEESRVAAMAQRLGLPAEVLDAQQTAKCDPHLQMNIVGSVLYSCDCHLTPGKLMETLQATLISRGVSFVWNTTIDQFHSRDSKIAAVSAGSNQLDAEEFVMCAGVWSDKLLRSVRLKMPMQAGKGYSLTLSNPPQLPRLPAILVEGRVAVTPMESTLRFGGTMELAGIETKINRARVRGIVKSALHYFPAFREADFAAVTPWCGLRPCTPDGLPYLGRSTTHDNLTIATGHAMMGISLAPITGKIVADLVAGVIPAFDLRLVSPQRFS
jgi:D-amino-acid dehydrogenase